MNEISLYIDDKSIILDKLTNILSLVKKTNDIAIMTTARGYVESLRYAAKEARLTQDIQNEVAETKLRIERRVGEHLASIDRQQGKRTDIITSLHDEARSLAEVVREAEINKRDAHNWQTIAAMPEADFEAHIVETKEEGKELTTAGTVRVAKKAKQQAEAEVTQGNILDFEGGDRKYHAIVIDPPWPTQKILRDVRPKQDVFDYPTMTVEEISKLPITDLAHPEGCHVYLWVTHKFLPVGLQLFEQWGVKYECIMTWVKNVGFTPFSWMYSTEHVLFGRIGSLSVLRKGLRLDFKAAVQGHSRKPDEFYQRVIEASPNPRIDLFARQPRDGFEIWGNEV